MEVNQAGKLPPLSQDLAYAVIVERFSQPQPPEKIVACANIIAGKDICAP